MLQLQVQNTVFMYFLSVDFINTFFVCLLLLINSDFLFNKIWLLRQFMMQYFFVRYNLLTITSSGSTNKFT